MIANSHISSSTSISNNPADSINNYIDGLHVTPPIISTAYGIPSNNGSNVKVGIVSLGGGWLPSDLQKSLGNLGLALTQNITSVLVDGAGNVFSTSDSNASLENTLDLYCIAGMVPGANIVIYTGNVGTTQNWANVFQRAIDEGCDVITHSWGTDESNGYGAFLESVFANAASQGITIVCSSGDNGSEGASANGNITVDYPASSPNVVAVGGTILNYNAGTYARIAETPSGSSGGGVSTLFSVPSWQTGLQANLFFSSNSYSHVTTLTNRGVPDISAPYQTYPLWYNGNIAQVVGTSAAAPIVAGTIARYISLNGRRPIPGAIHKIMYANSSAYYDFGVGYNNDEALNGGATGGYATASGWDPVTGLGAPNGTALYQEVTSGGTQVKTAANTWSYVANVKVKTAANTWSNVRAIYTKTINGWSQTF